MAWYGGVGGTMTWAWFEWGSRHDNPWLGFGGMQRECELPQNPKPARKSRFQVVYVGEW